MNYRRYDFSSYGRCSIVFREHAFWFGGLQVSGEAIDVPYYWRSQSIAVNPVGMKVLRFKCQKL